MRWNRRWRAGQADRQETRRPELRAPTLGEVGWNRLKRTVDDIRRGYEADPRNLYERMRDDLNEGLNRRKNRRRNRQQEKFNKVMHRPHDAEPGYPMHGRLRRHRQQGGSAR